MSRYIQFVDRTMDVSTGDKLVEVPEDFFARLQPHERALRMGNWPGEMSREISRATLLPPVDDVIAGVVPDSDVVEIAIC